MSTQAFLQKREQEFAQISFSPSFISSKDKLLRYFGLKIKLVPFHLSGTPARARWAWCCKILPSCSHCGRWEDKFFQESHFQSLPHWKRRMEGWLRDPEEDQLLPKHGPRDEWIHYGATNNFLPKLHVYNSSSLHLHNCNSLLANIWARGFHAQFSQQLCYAAEICANYFGSWMGKCRT